MSDSTISQPKPARPRNNWGWISFFAFVVVASIGVMVFMIWFNLRVQLRPEQLAAARRLWDEKQIKNYDMIYTEKHSPDDKVITFHVKVRNGEVREALMNGSPLVKNDEQKDDPKIFRSMNAIFRDIQRFMDNDAKPGAPRVYVTATFDPESGRVIRYVRRVMRSSQRVEIVVKDFQRTE
ncbi:MAG: hypothetical protein HYX68_19575 [Planctomycetes bacterium]|nr:hypothetical protein [Planctomycetota bacterium]